MPRVCTVCSSPNRSAINQAIVDGKPHLAIARTWNVKRDAVKRHQVVCLAKRLADNAEKEGRTLSGLLKRGHEVVEGVLQEAEGELALKAVDRLTKLAELEFGSLIRNMNDSREQWRQLTPEQKRERLALMEQRLAQARAELDSGGGLQ